MLYTIHRCVAGGKDTVKFLPTKLTAIVIGTFYCVLSFFNLQQYSQTYETHEYCSPKFGIYLVGSERLLIKI